MSEQNPTPSPPDPEPPPPPEPRNGGPYSFDDILQDELAEIRRSRWIRGSREHGFEPTIETAPENAAEDERARRAHAERQRLREANASNLFGLAFSGGGIRSATFALGVLQALSRYRMLTRVDYLSTVSGGGYIGGWLSAWFKRVSQTRVPAPGGGDRPPTGAELAARFEGVQQTLADSARTGTREPVEVTHLRQHSNYLTPRTGLFSADTWAAVSIYVRNVVLNLGVLVGAMATVLLGLRLVHLLQTALTEALTDGRAWPVWAARVVLLLSWGTACHFAIIGATDRDRGRGGRAVYLGIVLPVFLSALAFGALVASGALLPFEEGWRPFEWQWVDGNSLFLTAVFVVAACLVFLVGLYPDVPPAGSARAALSLIRQMLWTGRVLAWGAGIVAGAAAAAVLVQWLASQMQSGFRLESDGWLTILTTDETRTVWIVPLIVALFSLGGTIYIGIMGRMLPSSRREWWGRLGGLFLSVSGAWVLLFLLTLGSSDLLGKLATWIVGTLSVGWLSATAGGLFAGRSSATTGARSSWLGPVATVAPYVFVIGLLMALSHLVESWAIPTLLLGDDPTAAVTKTRLLIAIGVLGVATLLLSWRIDINEFSLHNLYRNRLARCYLGAYEGRTAHPFTGFSWSDHVVAMSDLQQRKGYVGPYHLVNATLNLVGGDELAWQKRMAASFVFAPLYSGFGAENAGRDGNDRLACGLQPSDHYAGNIGLSEAVTASGAAASPNMGYHSSVPLAFLMTVFNVRLGLWLGNPIQSEWEEYSPPLSLGYLFTELFGLTTAKRDFVYISDGGHFENLGIYELVRRRCRFIIACDAEADPGFEFDGLGNAIEKCRTDFNIEIRIDIEAIRKAREQDGDAQHCVTGQIDYGEGVAPGTLLYVKASLTGDEPTDIKRYKSQHADFPHQTTGDQWFDETQFESHRRLGFHAMETALGAVGSPQEVPMMSAERLFELLDQRWHPPSPYSDVSFSRHGEQFNELMHRLSSNPGLRFLDIQLNPSWKFALNQRAMQAKDMELPSSEWVRREAYFLCRELFQLMENVYLDLHLETEFEHPDNQGWMNLFRNWSWSTMCRVTWAATATTYGTRFRTFCERRLELRPGEVTVGAPQGDATTLATDLNFAELEYAQEVAQLVERPVPADVPPPPPRSKLLYYPLRLSVELALRTPMYLPIGFAVLADGTLIYLRIQDHLRHAGLGERAVRALLPKISDLYRWAPPEGDPIRFAEDDARGVEDEEGRVLIDRRSYDQMVNLFRRARP